MPRYTVHRRLVSIGRDYDVKDEAGRVVFRLDGKLPFARTFVVRDGAGQALLFVREKLLTLDPTFEIESEGRKIASVRRTTTSGAGTDKFEIPVEGAQALMLAQGKLLLDGVELRRAGASVGSVSRRHGTVVDEDFHVTVAPGEDQALTLAVAMAIVETDPSRGEDRSS